MGKHHDALFQKVFSTPERAAELFRCALPPHLAALLDWNHLRPVPAEFRNGQLQAHRGDLLFVAPLLDDALRSAYLLLEHKSGRDLRDPGQIPRYRSRVFERHREVHPDSGRPLVIPVLVHHGRRPWDPEGAAGKHRSRHPPPPDAGPYLEDAGIARFDLALMDEATIRRLPMAAIGRLSLLCLQFLPGRGADVAEACLRRWADLLVEAHQPGEAFEAVSWYIVYVAKPTLERLGRLYAELIGPEGKEMVMGTGARIEREALKRGRDEGRAEIVLRQLAARFGPVPDAAMQRVRAGSAADLERWAIAVLTARSLDEVLAG